MRLSYVMKFVADMDKAVAFYRDAVGLKLRFQSPDWSEFATGETTLALHIASAAHPAGSAQLGFGVDDVDAFHREKSAAGVVFTRPPTREHHVTLADLLDSEGAEISVSS
jgi:catechol 2,3-dioxygenase-like lactoylglutathione lyase family enzyme